MTIQTIKRVAVAIGLDRQTSKPVIRHWIDEFAVTDSDPVHIYFKLGNKRAAISRTYHLHPLDVERPVPTNWSVNFHMEFGKAEIKRFSPDQSEVLYEYSEQYCRVGYELELLQKMVGNLRKFLLAGASFRLACIDDLEALAALDFSIGELV